MAFDFDRVSRFVLKSPQLKLDDLFNVSQLVGGLRLSRIQENLIRMVWAEFPSVLLKHIDFEHLAFFLQQATAMRQIFGPNCEALFRDITYCKHHCYPNVAAIHDGKTARLICINRQGIRENKPITFGFVRPFRSRQKRQDTIKALTGEACVCSQCYSPDLSRSFKCSWCPGTMHPSYDYDVFECSNCARRMQIYYQKAGLGQEHAFGKKIENPNIFDIKKSNLIQYFEQRHIHPVHYLGYEAILKQVNHIIDENLTQHFGYCKEILSIALDAIQDWPSLFYNHEGLEICRKLLLFQLSEKERTEIIKTASHIVDITMLDSPTWLDSGGEYRGELKSAESIPAA